MAHNVFGKRLSKNILTGDSVPSPLLVMVKWLTDNASNFLPMLTAVSFFFFLPS